jgi:hypothetical protein
MHVEDDEPRRQVELDAVLTKELAKIPALTCGRNERGG